MTCFSWGDSTHWKVIFVPHIPKSHWLSSGVASGMSPPCPSDQTERFEEQNYRVYSAPGLPASIPTHVAHSLWAPHHQADLLWPCSVLGVGILNRAGLPPFLSSDVLRWHPISNIASHLTSESPASSFCCFLNYSAFWEVTDSCHYSAHTGAQLVSILPVQVFCWPCLSVPICCHTDLGLYLPHPPNHVVHLWPSLVHCGSVRVPAGNPLHTQMEVI